MTYIVAKGPAKAYKTINSDPTNKLKAKLIQKLKKIKRETNMEEGMYRTMYPTSCTAPSFMGYQKCIKRHLLRPIVSSRCSVTYGMAKVIVMILKPLVGKSLHHIQSTRDLVCKVREVTLLPGECLSSYVRPMLLHCSPLFPQTQCSI